MSDTTNARPVDAIRRPHPRAHNHAGAHSRRGRHVNCVHAAQARPLALIFGSFAPNSVPSGLDAALDNLLASPLRERYELEVVSVYRNSSPARGMLRRLGYGSLLFAQSVRRLRASRCSLADVHAVSGRDFLKSGAVLMAARATQTPVALRIHGGDFDRAYADASTAERRITRALLRVANRVVLLAKSWENIVTEIEPSARTAVIPNSVDCAALRAAGAQRPPGARNVLMLGGFCERKGHFDAVEAAAMVSRSHADARFLFFGSERDPGAASALRARIDLHGLANTVFLVNPVFGKEKLAQIAKACILILPSHVENMPMAVMEAMAAGLPVVATKVGAIPEMVADGETGILVEPRQPAQLARAIEQLLENSRLRRDLGARAAAIARTRWDTAVVGRQTAELYDSIARSP